MPRRRAWRTRSSWHSLNEGVCQGRIAPSPQRLAGVGNHEVVVDADDATEAAALVAGPERRVEREQRRQRILVVQVALGAVQVARVASAVLLGAGVIERVHADAPMAGAQRRFQRLGEARGLLRARAQAVLDDGQRRSPFPGAAAHSPAARSSARISETDRLRRHRNREAHQQPRSPARRLRAASGRWRCSRRCRGAPAGRTGGSGASRRARTGASGDR